MTVYTTILANYLFWIAQCTMIFLWSPRNWQYVGMWVVQCNKLKAGNSGLSYEQLQPQCPYTGCFPEPSAMRDLHNRLLPSPLFLPSSVLAELCWNLAAYEHLCVALHTGAVTGATTGGIQSHTATAFQFNMLLDSVLQLTAFQST